MFPYKFCSLKTKHDRLRVQQRTSCTSEPKKQHSSSVDDNSSVPRHPKNKLQLHIIPKLHLSTEQYSWGHTPLENMHADTVHTQTALFLDQKECLDGRWSPLNCEKQFGGDTSLRLLIIERFTAAIGLIHRKDWRAAGSVSLPILQSLIGPASSLLTLMLDKICYLQSLPSLCSIHSPIPQDHTKRIKYDCGQLQICNALETLIKQNQTKKSTMLLWWNLCLYM